MISPKKQFLLSHKKEAEALAKLANDPALTIGITYAMAELACLSYPQEQLTGAKLAFETLLSLPIASSVPVRYEAKQLRPMPSIEEFLKQLAETKTK